MFGQYVHFMRFAPAGNDYSKSRYLTQAHPRVARSSTSGWRTVPYLAGSEYSVADVATFPWLRNIPALLGAEAMAKLPNIARWVKAIDERPAVKKALAEVDAVRAQHHAVRQGGGRDAGQGVRPRPVRRSLKTGGPGPQCGLDRP